MTYPHLRFIDWPFRIVPEPAFCDFLADRGPLARDVEALLSSLENRPTSDIQLLWSWLGAGKTHTLFYISNQCYANHDRLLPIYTELPRESSGFSELYRSTISQLKVEQIIDAFLDFTTRPTTKAGFSRAFDPDLQSALTQAALGERPLQVLLGQWLLGNPLPASAHRELGVGARINSTDKCSAVLADIISILAPRGIEQDKTSSALQRVLWIVDEVQRVEDTSAASQRSLLSGLVGVFNRCATGLTILLSYTGAPEEKGLPLWIPPDLADRIGLEKPMLLPPLRSDEAKTFVRDVFARFRSPEYSHTDEFFPFEPAAISDLLGALQKKADLKPRTIMEALDASLRNLEPALRTGVVKTIGVQAMRDSLQKLSLEWVDSSSKPKK